MFELCKKLRGVFKFMIIVANKCDLLMSDDLWKLKIKKLGEEFSEYEFNLKKATEAKFINYILGEFEFEIVDSEKLNENQKKGLGVMAENLKKIGGEKGECYCRLFFDAEGYYDSLFRV